jgi:hypothetical protein
VLAAIAEFERDLIVERTLDGQAEVRRSGNLRRSLGGLPVLGYADTGSADWEVVPAEAKLLRDMADAVLAREPLSAAFAAWQKTRPVPVRPGGQVINESMIRAALQRPATAGLIMKDGVVVAHAAGDPPLDPAKWRQVRAVFATRKRGKAATGEYPFGRLLRCAKCGNQLSGAQLYDRRRGSDGRLRVVSATPAYRCRNPHKALGVDKPCNGVSVPAGQVHDLLRAATEGWAATSPAWAAATAARAGLGAERARLEGDLADRQEWMADLVDKRNREQISAARFTESEAELARQIEGIQAGLAAVASAEANPLPAALKWDVLTGTEQCRLVELAFVTPIEVQPGNGGARARNAADRIDLKPRPGGTHEHA